MELRDFVNIFWKQRQVLMSIIVVSGLIGWMVFMLQSPIRGADLTLNIARTGVQQTADYRYDGFYRLQADERFADTVVRWLESPRILSDISVSAKVQPIDRQPWQFGGAVQSERLSSQVIRVQYRTRTVDEAKRFSQSLLTVLNRETERLNGKDADESWFVVEGGEPVVTDGRFDWLPAIGLAVACGVFVAFWTGLIRYYWKKK
jgi:hypothetical protein